MTSKQFPALAAAVLLSTGTAKRAGGGVAFAASRMLKLTAANGRFEISRIRRH